LLEQALADLALPKGADPGDPAMAGLVAAGDAPALAAGIEARMREADLPLKASRTPEEIARRLIEKTSLAETRLSEATMAALKAFLSIRVPLGEASEALTAFAGRNDIALGAALERFSAR